MYLMSEDVLLYCTSILLIQIIFDDKYRYIYIEISYQILYVSVIR